MNDKQKQELLTLIGEFGQTMLRGLDLSSQCVLLEIQNRIKSIPVPAEVEKP